MPKHDPESFPVGLAAQFRRNLGLYTAGAALLAGQQLLMAKRDFLVKAAVDAADAKQGSAGKTAAILMLVVSVAAAVMRVLSRITVFTGGRNVEYELRAVLLARLHKLGPAFFRKMPTGEIMSRATNDLGQVRLLLGFGVLNVVGSLFALGSALYVMLHISGKLTLAALLTLPVLMLVTRSFSGKLFRVQPREPGGDRQDERPRPRQPRRRARRPLLRARRVRGASLQKPRTSPSWRRTSPWRASADRWGR